MLPLLRDKAARYVCHSPYARDPYDQLCTVSVASCAHTPSSWYRCSSTTMQPCTYCCRRVRIHPHKQSCAVSRVSCVHAQKQPVPLLPSNDVDRYTVSASIYVPVRVFVLCPCGVMRTYTGAALAAAPQRRRSPVRLTSRQVRIHPDTRPCSVSVPSRARAQEQHVLPLLRDNAARSSLCRCYSATT